MAAYWLAQLLVNGIPPILVDSRVTEVHLQTERLGWRTDDFLIECAGTTTAKLAGQVKRSFSVRSADEECRKAVGDFWHDFKGWKSVRSCERPPCSGHAAGNKHAAKSISSLSWIALARPAMLRSLSHWLGTGGLISEKAIRYCGELKNIIGMVEARSLSAGDLWPFLRVLHLLSLDLHTPTRQTEAHIKSLLAYTVRTGDALREAQASCSLLLDLASVGMEQGRSLQRDDLPEELRQRHNFIAHKEEQILQSSQGSQRVCLSRNSRGAWASGFPAFSSRRVPSGSHRS